MSQPLLSVKSLKVSFKRGGNFVPVVHGLDAEVFPGKTLAIVGESGSGKSVSSLSILQLHNQQTSEVSGNILFNQADGEVDILRLNKEGINALRGQGISMIFQEPMAALNPVITCGEQVAEMISIHQPNLSKQEIRELVLGLFEEVELPRPEPMMHDYPHQLSGGQQQRVMIAMALANKPDLLIADEPTTALDPQVQDGIIDLLKKIQQKTGMAIIFISHDLDAVEKIADDLIVMQYGEVVESGKAKEVLKNPKHPYTKGLLSCKPGPDKKGLRLPTVKNYLDDPGFIPQQNPVKPIGPEAILEVKDLSVIYRSGGWFKAKTEVAAISKIDLRLLKGETVGIIGPSGCGKTTLGRVIAGWVRPTHGEVLLNGVTYIDADLKPGKEWSREVQLIFQDPFGSLNPKIKIGDAISEPMLVHGLAVDKLDARGQTEWLLEKVGLQKEYFDRYPHEFSGGQRQRIVIARALAVKPKILICDESVAALDVSVQAQVLNLLNDLQRELGLSYLFISHDHNVIAYFCDRIVEMEMGKIRGEKENGSEKPKQSLPIVEAKETVDVGPIIELEEEVPKTIEAELVADHIDLPDELIADQVSAEILKMRLDNDHRKLERLAEELHLPIVTEHAESEIDAEPAPEVKIEAVEEVEKEEEPSVAEVSAEILIPEAAGETQALVQEEVDADIASETVPEETTEEAAPERVQTTKTYRSLGDFIKTNKS